MEPLISLRNLEKSIEAGPNKFFLLRRVTLDIAQGEFVTIMGPSGAGKSTLLSIIGMLDSSWTGEYYFLDQAVHRLNEGSLGLRERAQRIGGHCSRIITTPP